MNDRMTPEECVADAPLEYTEWRACAYPERPFDGRTTFNDDCRACRTFMAACLRNGHGGSRGWADMGTGATFDTLLDVARYDAERHDDPILLAAVELAEARA